jgi:hypothetical protein
LVFFYTTNIFYFSEVSVKHIFKFVSIYLQTQRWCHHYCCSIGLKLAELRTTQEWTRLRNEFMAKFNNLPGILNCFIGCHGVLLFELHFAARGYVGDVYVSGQKKDVWCRSHVVATDSSAYWYGKVEDDLTAETCYKIHYSSATLVSEKNVFCTLDSADYISSNDNCYCTCSD